MKMSKTKQYRRDRNTLLIDFHSIINDYNLSTSFKFHNLRNDFLPTWTGIDEFGNDVARINNPFWSQDVIDKKQENTANGFKTKRDILKELQHDHIVPILFFEELIMEKVNNGTPIPFEALEFLFRSFAMGAMVTAHQNQRSIDKTPTNINGKMVWKKKQNRKFGMPYSFYDSSDKLYLNPWARYVEAGIVMKKENNSFDYFDVKIEEALLKEKAFWDL